MRQIKPYGSWKSPITADLIVAGTITLSEITIDGEDIYWLEGRPSELRTEISSTLHRPGSTLAQPFTNTGAGLTSLIAAQFTFPISKIRSSTNKSRGKLHNRSQLLARCVLQTA
jgi:hypothetical protein